MKGFFTLFLFTLISISLYSQNSAVSVELSYPLPAGDNFIQRSYNGIVDAGVKVRAVDIGAFRLGGAFNSTILVKNNDVDTSPLTVNITAIGLQPKLFVELDSPLLERFHPHVGVGYSFFVFSIESDALGDFGTAIENETQSGVNFHLGVAYDFTERFFLQVQYDFTKLSVDNIPVKKVSKTTSGGGIGPSPK